MASPGCSSGKTSVQKKLYISETTSDSEAVLSDSEDEHLPHTSEEESSEKESSGLFLKMAPKYKLTYFPIMGMAEPIRFLLSYGKIEFEDERCESDKWQSIKQSTPFGQVPVLEIDGKKTWQSIAICRYLGKQVGLAGANDWENLQIDMAVDTISDIRSKISSFGYEADAALKEKKKATVLNENLPFLLPRLDKLVKDNGGYLANGKLSWADLYFVAVLDIWNSMIGFDITKDYSNLAALKNTVREIPAIKEWISKRPKTER